MDERIIRRGVEISIFSAIVVVAMRALAGGAGAEFRELDNFRRIGHIVKADATQALIVFAFVIEMRVVVFAHGSFGSGIGNRSLRSSHEDPFLQLLVVSDLDLSTFECALVEHHGLANVADVDDVALLEHVPAVTAGHHLHFAAATLPRSKMGEKLHIADVHPAIEVRDAVGSRVAVMVGPSSERRGGQGQARSRRGLKELTTTGEKGALPAAEVP